MTPERLREARRAEPFRPFRVRVTDGRVFVVPGRDFIAVHPAGSTVFVFGAHDEMDILDAAVIADIEFETSPPLSA
jgi:hypothetical protein